MLRKETARSYQEFSDDEELQPPVFYQDNGKSTGDLEETEEEYIARVLPAEDTVDSNPFALFNKACLKNVFTVLLLFIYLLLTAVAVFLAYQTITDFMEKLNHPVMSVTYKEVDVFSPPGIALYPGTAQLLSCKHHYHAHIPPLVTSGKPQPGDCVTEEVTYTGPYNNHTVKKALVVSGPTDVRNREVVFLQFSQNETEEDFSAITYMLFDRYNDLFRSVDRSAFMQDCERNYSMWTFSGGFRTWVKMSLVKTSGKANESMEFRQESSVVKYNDKRSGSEQKGVQLFFVVFEWRDPYVQEVRDIVTANPWNTVAILCGVFMALFKAANFASFSVKWVIKIRKRHLRNRNRELNHISSEIQSR
ncbi:proton-activated chloride channel [Esox lucius]|uniref:Proton-activated chloride channel n=1 Tax=Esox lucius TaxID=8010 RepID=A0A3P8Z7C7_ESOLU|nr:proton-activated chloride channel [Esox lucius]